MAWQTAPHAEAPPGAICYGGEEPGTVTWWEPDDEGAGRGDRQPPPPPPDPNQQPQG